MIGHGSPSSSLNARGAPYFMRALLRWWCALIATSTLLVGVVLDSGVNAQESPASEPVRLRISWGGGRATAWRGRAWLNDGVITDLKLLGKAADATASTWLDGGQVRIRSLSPRKHDEIEVAADAGNAAQLFVELVPASAVGAVKPPSPLRVPLTEVLHRPVAIRLDDAGTTLRVEHVPPDALQIVTGHENFLFAPGDQLSFEVRPHLSDMEPGTSLDILTTVTAAPNAPPVWNAPQRLEIPVDGEPAAKITIPLPKSEGAYTVRVTATRSPGFRPRFFPGGASAAERTFDVVVLDREPPRSKVPEAWDTVLEIDPTSPSWWERLPNWSQLRRFPAINFRQIGTRTSVIDLPSGRFVELPPTTENANPHWQAYTLPLESPGVPHLLEIDYPADAEQHFSLSITEPSAEIFDGIGADGGVYVEGFGRQAQKQTYRMVFWPRTQSPMLMVANQHPTAPAIFGHIRVLKRNASQLTTAPATNEPAERLVAAYITRPQLSETFGGTSDARHTDALASAAQPPDDWHAGYENATLLAEWVRYSGCNSAVVNVLADGSSLFEHAQASAATNEQRHGDGLPQPDQLELLLRVFDRENLALVPALQLAAPLPELEALRRGSDPQTSGLEWLGPNGKTWVETHGTDRGLAPYYNLLDKRVQRAIANLVKELMEQYGSHAAFAGLSIQLSANGYAQLPPLDWGLDDATIARFARDTGIQLPDAGPTRFAARHALLTGEHADEWRAWRTEQVTRFYAELAAMLRRQIARDDAKLILTLEEAFANPSLAARVRPAILGLPNRVETTLMDVGVDRIRLQSTPGIALCPTRYIESMSRLPERAIDLELNEAFAMWPRPADATHPSAALLYHRTQRGRLAAFQSNTLWRSNGPVDLVVQPSAHAAAMRQPYARMLLQHDPAVLLDGGELLPLAQDDALRQTREIIRRLPIGVETADVVKQPVGGDSIVRPPSFFGMP
jgi:hypothetical protein